MLFVLNDQHVDHVCQGNCSQNFELWIRIKGNGEMRISLFLDRHFNL